MYTKAYDVKELLAQLKTELPELGEESAKKVLKHIFPWLKESAVLSETKVDDFLAVAYPLIETQLGELAEDINKADNA